jgi:hypothetical protein
MKTAENRRRKAPYAVWRNLLRRVGAWLSRIALAAGAAWPVSLWAVPAAARARGRAGMFGGEYILIAATFALTFWLLGLAKKKGARGAGRELRYEKI